MRESGSSAQMSLGRKRAGRVWSRNKTPPFTLLPLTCSLIRPRTRRLLFQPLHRCVERM